MIKRNLPVYRGDTYKGSRAFIFNDIPNLHISSVTVQFSVKRNQEDSVPVISFPITASDPGNDWSESVRRIAINLETGHTQHLKGGIYFWDLEVNYAGVLITVASGDFILTPDIARTVNTITPITESEIYANLASNDDSLGASLVGVKSSFWNSIAENVQTALVHLFQNRLKVPSSFVSGRLVKTGTSTPDTEITGISVSSGNEISGVKSVTVSDDPSASGHLTKKSYVDGLIEWVRDRANHIGSQAIATIIGLQAALDSKPTLISGKIPSTYLPSYVDDVIDDYEYDDLPEEGETGKIYIDPVTNRQYRWSGSVYVDIITSPGTSDAVLEGVSNLYFTTARVLATALTGLNLATGGAIVSTDSILVALGKIQYQITNISTVANSFLALTDTPSFYTGKAGQSVIVNQSENALIFQNVLGLLDSKWSSRKFSPSASEPWFRKDQDQTFDIANWPVLVPGLRGVKWEIGAATTFNVIGFSTGSVTRLQLEDTLLARNLMRSLLEDYQFSKSYTSSTNADTSDSDTEFSNWGFIVRIATDIGSGTNAPKSGQEFRIKYLTSLANTLSVSNRYICIDKDTSSSATTGTGTIEVYPYRLASGGVGNSNQAKWRKITEAGLMSPGATFYSGADLVEVPANARIRDRFQGHRLGGSGGENFLMTGTGFGGSGSTLAAQATSTGDPISNGSDGGPRTGPNTRSRAGVEYLYGNGVIYNP